MKKLMLFLMWLTASAAAVGVAWAGVSVVDNQAVAPPSAADLASPTPGDDGPAGDNAAPESQPATSSDVESELSPMTGQGEDSTADGETPTVPTTTAPSTSSPSASSPSTPSTPRSSTSPVTSPTPQSATSPTSPSSASPTSQPAASPTSQPAASPTPRPTTSPTSQAAPTATPAPQPTATTPAPTPAPTTAPASTQTFTLVGGTAAISFSTSGVEVLWATANPGFDVEIEPESPGIKVEFRADHHRSRVDAWWSGGPQHAIREEPRD